MKTLLDQIVLKQLKTSERQMLQNPLDLDESNTFLVKIGLLDLSSPQAPTLLNGPKPSAPMPPALRLCLRL